MERRSVKAELRSLGSLDRYQRLNGNLLDFVFGCICSDEAANESLHTQAENKAARQQSRQLIDGGADAVDWIELYEQK